MSISQEALPWLESPFGSRNKAAAGAAAAAGVTKCHDNPLFKSSPTDILNSGEFRMSCEDSKENCAGTDRDRNSGSGKVFQSSGKVANSTLTRTSSKRVLGERNSVHQPENQDFAYAFNEPPKTIRALSFPSVDFGSSSSAESSPVSPSSPASRFPLCLSPVPTESPTGSEDSSDSLEGHHYDPKMNLRTPRPKFLRYRPDWRLELISSFELAQGETLVDALNSGKPREDVDFSTRAVETVTDTDEGNRLDSKINSTSVDETLEEEKGEAGGAEEDIGTGNYAEETISPAVSAEKDFTSGSSGITFKAVLKMVLLGTFAALALLTTDGFGLLPHGSFVSEFWQRDRHVSTHSTAYDPQEGWEWSPEYDMTESFDNETVYELFSSDSPELDTLLLAIMSGSDVEIQERYEELMEREEETEYYNYDQLLDELSNEESHEENLVANDIDHAPVEQQAGADVAEQELLEEAGLELEHDLIPLPIIDGIKLHEDLKNLKNLFTSREFLLPAFQILLLVTAVLGIPIYIIISRNWPAARAATGPVSKAMKPKTTEDLVITPECLKLSPYGSFTAYKRTVVNEGSKDEHVKLTPVRRSSRIQNHHHLEPVRRRILLDL